MIKDGLGIENRKTGNGLDVELEARIEPICERESFTKRDRCCRRGKLVRTRARRATKLEFVGFFSEGADGCTVEPETFGGGNVVGNLLLVGHGRDRIEPVVAA